MLGIVRHSVINVAKLTLERLSADRKIIPQLSILLDKLVLVNKFLNHFLNNFFFQQFLLINDFFF